MAVIRYKSGSSVPSGMSNVGTGSGTVVVSSDGGRSAADSAGKTIDDYKKLYAEARARGDSAGMQAANDGANAIRVSQGLAEEKATADIALIAGQKDPFQGQGSPLALGKGPLSQEGYLKALDKRNDPAPLGGTLKPVDAGSVILKPQAQQERQAGTDDDLTQYLRKQKAAELESTLAGLKGAYNKSMAEYDATLDKLPQRYRAARNDAAAQAAIAQRNFNERAAADGLNSGASGQAALDASANYRGALAQLDQSQAAEAAEIDRAKAALTAQYETAIQQARAEGDATLAQMLYQEMVRLQGLTRQDEQTAYDRGRDTLEDQRYDREYADLRADTEYERKAETAALMAQFGNFGGYAELFGLDEATVAAMAAEYARQKQLTQAQAARELADWYAQYGDFSKLRELGVTPNLAAPASTKGGGGGDPLKKIDDDDDKKPKYDPNDFLAAPGDVISRYAQRPKSYLGRGEVSGGEAATGGQASAQNMAAIKQTLARAAQTGGDVQRLMDSVWDSGQYSDEQKQELLNYIRALGGSVG